jgi:Rps23 Pro-64 3,4-dihydroxylase Tpa1-like proline 4-hydroxylase
MSVIRPLDIEALRRQFDEAEPYRHLCIDDFLERDFALEVAAEYPDFETALARGFSFNYVNERKKVQVTDSSKFPPAVQRLHEAISSQEFRDQLSQVTGIPSLLADPTLVGGGMHVTGPHGRLDVHVDFNYVEDRKLHRRLNILIYLNPEWHTDWGGEVELWDREVRRCYVQLKPRLGRCVIFETSDISFHGVTAATCPEGFARKSFAAYYYTQEAPPRWDGVAHSTIFRARPDERLRGYVLMPAEKLQRAVKQKVVDRLTRQVDKVRKLVGG